MQICYLLYWIANALWMETVIHLFILYNVWECSVLLNELTKERENLFIRKLCIYQNTFVKVFNELYIRLRCMLLEKKENWLWLYEGNFSLLVDVFRSFVSLWKALPWWDYISYNTGIVITIVFHLCERHKLHCIWAHLPFTSTLQCEYDYYLTLYR